MKKRTLIIAFALVLLSALPVVAYAANLSNASTTVTYTVEYPQEPPQEALPASYEIHIPATLSLNDGHILRITANNVYLNTGQTLAVYIDGNSFGDDGYLHLTSENYDIIKAALYQQNYAAGQEEPLQPNDSVYRYTEIGVDSARPGIVYIDLGVQNISDIRPSSYSGILYFYISIQNN